MTTIHKEKTSCQEIQFNVRVVFSRSYCSREYISISCIPNED